MANYIPNLPAPERAYGQYTGPMFLQWSGGTTGHQPQGANNPLGDVASIPVMSINAETLETLSGPQPG
jgi:hypothetical protein